MPSSTPAAAGHSYHVTTHITIEAVSRVNAVRMPNFRARFVAICV